MRILAAESDRTSQRALEALLRAWGHDVVAVADGKQALAVLARSDGPKLAILDWMMSGMDGLEVSRHLRRADGGEYVYIIILTARNEKRHMLEGLEAGADDYVIKPFDPRELKVRLRAGERVLDLQAELIAARESLREQATHDALTRLWNRRAVLDILAREVVRAARDDTSVGVIMADLDHFKAVNDTYGHRAGDAVLVELARRLQSAMRPYDMVGRYGGEEFIMVVPRCDATFGGYVAERLRQAVVSEPFSACGQSLSVTLSLGVAACRGSTDPEGECLIQAADAALYEAKRAGRNRVMVADSLAVAAEPV